ncbi:MAG: hypothetical protein RBR81_07085 [Bacteroidales bacterium]|jgi:hypothetical protein|nr:hypothetical protein [Bacteroidales bacterium]
MNSRAVIYFVLSLISVVGALFIFFRGLDLKAILFLVLGIAAVFLFRLGVSEIKKK